jgi:uncharacterized membrane protein HdeD (DUF308 family)
MVSNTESAVSFPAFPWWIVLIEGILSLIFGIFLISEPVITSVFLVTVLGFYLLIRGFSSIIQIFVGGSGVHWGWLLLSGILGIIAGLVVLRQPLISTVIVASTVVIIVGVEGLIMGCVSLYQAFKGAGWGAGILGALTIVVSLLLLTNIWVATVFLPFVIAGFLIVGGIAAIVASFSLRRA